MVCFCTRTLLYRAKEDFNPTCFHKSTPPSCAITGALVRRTYTALNRFVLAVPSTRRRNSCTFVILNILNNGKPGRRGRRGHRRGRGRGCYCYLKSGSCARGRIRPICWCRSSSLLLAFAYTLFIRRPPQTYRKCRRGKRPMPCTVSTIRQASSGMWCRAP